MRQSTALDAKFDTTDRAKQTALKLGNSHTCMNFEAAGVDWLKSSGFCGVPANPLLDAAAVFSDDSILSSATISPPNTMSRCAFRLLRREELFTLFLKGRLQGACTEPSCRALFVPDAVVRKLFMPTQKAYASRVAC